MPDDDGPTVNDTWSTMDATTRHNVQVESLFSGFNGIFMGLAILAAPVVAVIGVEANALELTILVAAFPVGVFFGPLWAGLGRRIGMQRLVTLMAFWANIPLFLIFWVDQSWLFTLLVSIANILNSGMRMGQSSPYGLLYPKAIRGRVLGRLTFFSFVTMVPSILLTGWLLDMSHEMYRILYPLAATCGLIGAVYYRMLRVPVEAHRSQEKQTVRESLRGVQNVVANDRVYLLYQSAFFLSGSAFFMSTHIVLLLVNDHFGFTAFELALWMTVVPQLLLALTSPIWGRIYDRIGLVRCRMLISLMMSTYLASYWLGIVTGLAPFIWLGSMLLGMSNGGGQLTWALTSTHFAPRLEDVPLYNGIHFVLNGVRGLIVPWVGSVLWVVSGPGAVLAAFACSVASVPLLIRTLRVEAARTPQPDSPPTNRAAARVSVPRAASTTLLPSSR